MKQLIFGSIGHGKIKPERPPPPPPPPPTMKTKLKTTLVPSQHGGDASQESCLGGGKALQPI